MGLDMYLEARMFLSEYGENGKKMQDLITNAVEETHGMRPTYITCEAMYWRKCNSVHRWFVENVQDGNDDCGNYYVSRDNLEQLLSDINQVLDNPEQSDNILPSQSGFFFGDTEYNDYYFQNLRETKERITELLTDKYSNWEFYYSSSW
jgi:hypothetical protein